MTKISLAVVTIGLLFTFIETSNANDINPFTVSREPPPQLAPPSQQNMVMDPYKASQVYVTPYVPPKTISNPQIDSAINTAVQEAILHDERLVDAVITVSTQDGVVTLSGTVISKQQKDIAIQVAYAVGGVRDVKSNMSIQGATQQTISETCLSPPCPTVK